MNIPDEWTALGGEWRTHLNGQHSDFFTRDQSVMLVEHRMPPTPYHSARKVAAWMPVNNEMLADVSAPSLERMMQQMLDRHFRPWLYPDRRVLPFFDLFPRWTRLRGWFKRVFV